MVGRGEVGKGGCGWMRNKHTVRSSALHYIVFSTDSMNAIKTFGTILPGRMSRGSQWACPPLGNLKSKKSSFSSCIEYSIDGHDFIMMFMSSLKYNICLKIVICK